MIILAIVAALGLAAVTFVAPQVEALPPRPIHPYYNCFENPSPYNLVHPCGPPLRD
jgi:hypothetical protein